MGNTNFTDQLMTVERTCVPTAFHTLSHDEHNALLPLHSCDYKYVFGTGEHRAVSWDDQYQGCGMSNLRHACALLLVP